MRCLVMVTKPVSVQSSGQGKVAYLHLCTNNSNVESLGWMLRLINKMQTERRYWRSEKLRRL